ncbi:diadenylate cyclase [Natranaerovirga pectinivora]|uniref:Diadenylate cyclase n=1 Tax=Natranaerovirga pectinivora TaxID=682400 RepID=A0A4R3MK52_9FIRM|nr:diadenylate cyclase CdaA [Natranaerovirga pectinivora]TCT14665.1 diadenylate cyclase [Natranaerovirga pectinivora]
MNQFTRFLDGDRLSRLFTIPKVNMTDIIEIIIISFIIYHLIKLIKDTRAWMLFKGIIVLFLVATIASVFRLNTILWIFANTINVGIIAILIVFQPELRRALEQLGQRNFLASIVQFEDQKDKGERFSNFTIDELIKAVYELAGTKTGALIVVEQDIKLTEYERTGIPVDAVVTSQILMNIFEHNTPLHDGAIIIRNNRIVAATCYLPLSDNMKLSKELGTRHRAALGISEVSDSITIIVSEETGKVSISIGGNLIRNVNGEYLKNKLQYIQKKSIDVKKFKLWKGRQKNEKSTN